MIVAEKIKRNWSFYLFTVFEFPENADVVAGGDAFWVTASRLDVRFQRALQQLVHLSVVVVIMPAKTNQMDLLTLNYN